MAGLDEIEQEKQKVSEEFLAALLAGSQRLRDNRRMTDAAHNQHSWVSESPSRVIGPPSSVIPKI
jgi:hypothetical protein